MTFFNPTNGNQLPRLIILRGVSGAGKTTIANLLKQGAGYTHFEADHYFMQVNPQTKRLEYKFDATKLGKAHEWCLKKTEEALRSGHRVVVANTFTRRWELEPYLKLAASLGVTPTVLHAESEFQSIHGVPKEKIEEQRARWEPLSNLDTVSRKEK